MPAALTFQCPHCRHRYVDEAELLEAEQVHEFSCEKCRTPFQLQFLECPRCLADAALTWRATSPVAPLALRSCPRCGSPLAARDMEDIVDDEIGPAYPTIAIAKDTP